MHQTQDEANVKVQSARSKLDGAVNRISDLLDEIQEQVKTMKEELGGSDTD